MWTDNANVSQCCGNYWWFAFVWVLFRVFSGLQYYVICSSHLYRTLRNCHNFNFQALTGRPFPTVPSANWESNNYLYQIWHLLSTFQIMTQPQPAYNFMADICKMWIEPGLSLCSFEVIILFQRKIENVVDLRQVEKKPTVVTMWSIV